MNRPFLWALNHSWPSSAPAHGGGSPRVTLASASKARQQHGSSNRYGIIILPDIHSPLLKTRKTHVVEFHWNHILTANRSDGKLLFYSGTILQRHRTTNGLNQLAYLTEGQTEGNHLRCIIITHEPAGTTECWALYTWPVLSAVKGGPGSNITSPLSNLSPVSFSLS